jgi:hypothetical protein
MRQTLNVFEKSKSSIPDKRHPNVYFPSLSPRLAFRYPRATPAACAVL